MKKLSLLVLLLLAGCTQEPNIQPSESGDAQWRTAFLGVSVLVGEITFDGHRYLALNKGGIIHLESCECKTVETP